MFDSFDTIKNMIEVAEGVVSTLTVSEVVFEQEQRTSDTERHNKRNEDDVQSGSLCRDDDDDDDDDDEWREGNEFVKQAFLLSPPTTTTTTECTLHEQTKKGKRKITKQDKQEMHWLHNMIMDRSIEKSAEIPSVQRCWQRTLHTIWSGEGWVFNLFHLYLFFHPLSLRTFFTYSSFHLFISFFFDESVEFLKRVFFLCVCPFFRFFGSPFCKYTDAVRMLSQQKIWSVLRRQKKRTVLLPVKRSVSRSETSMSCMILVKESVLTSSRRDARKGKWTVYWTCVWTTSSVNTHVFD